MDPATATLIGLVIVSIVTSFLAPYLLRRQDYKRQDVVAERLIKSNKDIAVAVKQDAEKVAETAKNAAAQLDQIQAQSTAIHGLVNDAMTKRLKSVLSAHKATLVALLQLLEAGGRDPNIVEAISAVRVQIADVEQELSGRDAKAAEANAIIAAQGQAPRLGTSPVG